MKILNLGSLNLDKVYSVEKIVRPGETIKAANCNVYPGGKGLNQSIALARAGAKVFHAGVVGRDGKALEECLAQSGVNTDLLSEYDTDSGHAIIQVAETGQNSIIVFGGANQCIDRNIVDAALESFEKGDLLLVQNETSCVEYAIEKAAQKGMTVCFNPSPITPEMANYPLDKVGVFILNESEGQELSGITGTYEEIIEALSNKFPTAMLVLTVGKDGAYVWSGGSIVYHEAYSVKVLDTTAAGDTFTGYYLASLSKQFEIYECLENASRAAALAVGKAGASVSIPTWEQVQKALL